MKNIYTRPVGRFSGVLRRVMIVLIFGGICGISQAQTLLQWNTFGNAGTETTEPSVFNDVNISSANLTQGTITPAANGNRFGGSGWFNTGNTASGNTLSEAIAGNDYIQFVVTPNSGFSFAATSFVFTWDRSGITGPSSVTLRSSSDGFTSDLGTITGITAAAFTSNTITISGLSGITTATTFRLYGYGATATTGTGGFDIASSAVNVQLLGSTNAAPEINVQGNATSIADGDITPRTADHTDFGNVTVASSFTRTFTIQNTGTANLSISGATPYVVVTGTNASEFIVTTAPSNSVAAAASTAFIVTFTPTVTGLRTATLTINSNDADEAIYDFSIQGTGTPANSITTTAGSFGPFCNTSANSVTLTFSQTGIFTDPFNIQYSNPSGTFPTDAISQLLNYVSGTATTVTATTPISMAAGTGYRFRVVNATPIYYTSGDNGSDVTIISAAPATPGTITQPATTPCAGTTGNTYSIAAVSGATSYTWAVTGTGWAVTAGGITTSATITAGSGAGSVSVTATNVCGTSAAQTTGTITPNTVPATPGTITGSADVCTGISETYSIAAVAGATSYTWTVPAGWTVTSGAGTISITATTGSTSGNVSVAAVNTCGTSTVQALAVTVTTLTAPVATAGTSIGTTGFTANWNAVAGATNYFFDVYTLIGNNNIAFWTFPTSGTTVTPDTYSTNNSTKTLTTTGGTSVITSATGATTQAPSVTGWNSGSDTKAWQILIDATGFYNITLSSKQRSSDSGPRDFKVQYKLSFGGAWVDVTSGTVTVADNFTAGVLNNLSLPTVCNNQATLYIQWIMTSNTSVNLGTVASVGTSRIDDILISGSIYTYVPGYQNFSATSTSAVISGLSPNTIYYYVVRTSNGTCTSINSNEISVTTSPCTPTQTITSFAPTTGPAGTIVTITGTNFTGATSVAFGGIAATTFTFVNSTTITAEVPANVAATATISVTISCPVYSSGNFIFLNQTGTCSGVMSDLIISEVYDPASGNNHYIEIFNGTANAINLNSYKLEIQGNPGGGLTTISLNGILNAGGNRVYYAGTNGGLATSPAQGLGSGYNADDEIRLIKNSIILDRMVAPVATGYNWRRANTVTGPNATYTSSEWSLMETADGSLSTADIGTFTVTGSSIDFTAQPADQACNFSMAVTASGSPTTYQWKYYNTNTNTWDNVTSAAFAPATIPTSGVGSPTSSTLTISGDISGFLNYQFYMEIGKTGCGKISNAAQFLYSTKKYYFSNISTGNWTTPGSWTMSDAITGAGAIATCTYPNAVNSSGVYIRNGHTITLDTDVRENGVKIETGGSLITNANSTLDVLNGAAGADLIINGSFTDGANSTNTVGFVGGATWEISTGATIVKSNTSGASAYRDHYETGIINIPSGANWIYRYDNVATSTIGFVSSDASSIMYYPNLTLENTVSGNTFSSGFNAGSPNLSSFTMLGANNPIIIYGNFNVGGAGPGFINFINLNSNAPVRIDGNLEVKAGNMLTNFGNASNAGAGFEVKGNLIQNGTLTINGNNSGTLLLSGTATQTISGDNTIPDNMNVQNLTLTNTIGVTANKDFNTYGTYTMVGNAKFTLGTATVSLKSTTINTATVAQIPPTATIAYTGAGRFSIERYLPAYKSWRLLATPINTADATGTPSTISTAWREGGGAVVNGLGTQITGPVPGIGFDTTTQRGSMKWFDESIQNYREITNTNNTIARKEGYYLFVRGDRNVRIGGTTSATTLRMKGRIFDPANMPPQTTITTSGNFASVGNPYASAVDFSSLFGAALRIDNSYIAWDPTIAGAYGVGGFQTVTASTGYLATPGGSAFYNSTSDYRNIQSGEAFFVKSTAANATVSFTESMKAGSSRLASFTGDMPIAMFSTMLFAANGQIADGNRVVFNDQYSNSVDKNDASKMWNSGENFAMQKTGKTIVVEARQNLNAADTIFYTMSNLKVAPYQLKFAVQNIPQAGIEAMLEDKFLQTKTPISLTDSSFVNFNITADPASKVADRFILVFKSAIVLPVILTNLSAARLPDETVLVKWHTENELGINRYETEQSSNSSSFHSLTTKNAGNTGGSAAYSYTDVLALKSENYYRIKTISNTGEIHYSAVVKVAALNKAISISVNPNPVINKTVHLQMNNAEAGLYTLQLINNSGQVVYRGSITVSSNFQTIDFALNRNISSGNYRLMIKKPQTGREIIQRVTVL